MDNPEMPVLRGGDAPRLSNALHLHATVNTMRDLNVPKCRAQSPLGWADTQALAVDTAAAMVAEEPGDAGETLR